jgi:2,5-diamino-6-(ribosylamino)-4(3H)-pyrimidinone 5'-phosphate reductase
MAGPKVVVHVAVSLDGATTGFTPDLGRFYGLLPTWAEDVTLVGADTILAQEAALADAPMPGPTAGAPRLAVVDGRRRVSAWPALRDCGHWSGVLAIRAGPAAAGDAGRDTPEELHAGADAAGRVDLAAALDALGTQLGARVVRVDSGGALTGALLRAGLVDEVSLLVHPVLAGDGGDRRWWGDDRPPRADLEPIGVEAADGITWLRYRVLHRLPAGA